jgi:hypothetical protein
MIVGVFSDTHGLMRPQALAALAGSELILHAGDIGSPEAPRGAAAHLTNRRNRHGKPSRADRSSLTGSGRYVFSGRDPKKPMSEAAVNAALRRLGYYTRTEINGHGFRAMAQTILHQELSFDPVVVETTLRTASPMPWALHTTGRNS